MRPGFDFQGKRRWKSHPTGQEASNARRGRAASGGAAARRAARSGGGPGQSLTYIRRKIKVYEVLDEEGLAIIETNAETLMQEVGIEFRDYPRALELLKGAGADVKGERVRFPRGLARQLVCDVRRREFTQHARNPERSVQIGGKATVFAPIYGSPFVHDLDKGRRYGTIEDFHNFVKLAYMSALHPSLGRHGLRAGRPAGQQAPSRDGLCAYALVGQAVYGLGHAIRTAPRTRCGCPRSCSARNSSRRTRS